MKNLYFSQLSTWRGGKSGLDHFFSGCYCAKLDLELSASGFRAGKLLDWNVQNLENGVIIVGFFIVINIVKRTGP